MFLLGNNVANYIIETHVILSLFYFKFKGLYINVIISIVYSIIGTYIRSKLYLSFSYAVFGHIFIGLASVHVSNSVTRISVLWFKPASRVIATSFMVAFYM